MSGELFRALAWTFGAVLLPLGLVRIWLAVGLVTVAVQVGLAAALISTLGLVGVSIASTVAWTINALLAVVVAHRCAQLRLDTRTVLFVVAGLVLTAAAMGVAQLSGPFVPILGVGLVLGWLGVAIRREALQAGLARLRS